MTILFTIKRFSLLLKIVTLLLLHSLLASCIPAFFPVVTKSNRETEPHEFVLGTTVNDVSGSKRVNVVAFAHHSGSYHYLVSQQVDEKNCFFFALPGGEKYGLVAFVDRNGNGRYDPGEPVGVPKEADSNFMMQASGITNTRIILRQEEKIPADVAEVLVLGRDGAGISIPLHVGRITKLDEEQFAAGRGEMGPLSTLGSKVGLLFLEPYDAGKIPIIFVNGFGGCPLDWRYFVDSIDRHRFQPWFFYYPSGVRLHDAATVLNEFVVVLHKQYQFSSLVVTAHSMGGLIARDFILQNLQRQEDYIKLYVSISTPWLGHKSAEIAVRYAPAVVPSWIDMAPGSDFQRSLFTRHLSPDVRYFLFFSFKGKGDDGVVSLVSQLRQEAQDDAEKIFGYNEDHVSILASKEVLDNYRLLLSEVAVKTTEKVHP